MKRFHNQTAFAGIFVLAVLLFASNSFAALNYYLTLKGQKQGKIYKATPDAGGKFTFTNVEPDMYDLTFVVTATDQAGNTGSDAKVSKIEISSFSWGTTNSGSVVSVVPGETGRNTPVTRSNISNNRSFTVDATAPVVTLSGTRVATGDLNGDGVPDVISSPVSVTIDSHPTDPSQVSQIVLKNILVMSVSSPSGACKASYDLKKNVK